MFVISLQFNKEAGLEVRESKLRVVFVAPPQPPSPVAESAEEGLSPKAVPSVDNGDFSNFPVTEVVSTYRVSRDHCTLFLLSDYFRDSCCRCHLWLLV